jgi:hypothetical protein
LTRKDSTGSKRNKASGSKKPLHTDQPTSTADPTHRSPGNSSDDNNSVVTLAAPPGMPLSVGSAPAEQPTPTSLALNKRDQTSPYDVESFGGSTTTTTITGKKTKLLCKAKEPGTTIKVYSMLENGRVGVLLPDELKIETLSELYSLDETLHLGDQKIPMVVATPVFAAEEDAPKGRAVFIERKHLVEATHAHTEAEIEKHQQEKEAAEAKGWESRRKEIETKKDFILCYESDGFYLTDPVTMGTIPPGSYRILPRYSSGFLTSKAGVDQQAPFSPVISHNGTPFSVCPDAIWMFKGIAEEKARSSGVDKELTAAEVVSVLDGSELVKPFLPAHDWLRQEHIRYVTTEQLGMLIATGELTGDPSKAEEIKQANGPAYSLAKTVNGIHTGEFINIKETALGTGTEYHEAIHKLAHPAVNSVFGHFFNEGVTEYITKNVVTGLEKEGKIFREGAYEEQVNAIDALVQHAGVTMADLIDAYFNGNVGPLYEKVARFAVRGPFSVDEPFSLDGYAAHLDEKSAESALAVFLAACGVTAEEPSSSDSEESPLDEALSTANALLGNWRVETPDKIQLQILRNWASHESAEALQRLQRKIEAIELSLETGVTVAVAEQKLARTGESKDPDQTEEEEKADRPEQAEPERDAALRRAEAWLKTATDPDAIAAVSNVYQMVLNENTNTPASLLTAFLDMYKG